LVSCTFSTFAEGVGKNCHLAVVIPELLDSNMARFVTTLGLSANASRIRLIQDTVCIGDAGALTGEEPPVSNKLQIAIVETTAMR
jgi:hypothetical protein